MLVKCAPGTWREVKAVRNMREFVGGGIERAGHCKSRMSATGAMHAVVLDESVLTCSELLAPATPKGCLFNAIYPKRPSSVLPHFSLGKPGQS